MSDDLVPSESVAPSKFNLDVAPGERVELLVNAETADIDPSDADLTPEERAAERNKAVIEAVLTYLQTTGGADIANRIVALAERIQAGTTANAAARIRFEKWTQLVIIIGVITAASALAWLGKFDSTIAVLFGTLVGYVFGKKV